MLIHKVFELHAEVLLFYFFDEILLRLFDKIEINIRNENKNLSKKDYQISSEKYFRNTKTAINLANIYKVEKFYIVSIFNRLNLKDDDTIFFEYYLQKVNNLIGTSDFVEFINTKNFLESKDKNKLLFCDSMHHNHDGKILTGDIISNFINDQK